MSTQTSDDLIGQRQQRIEILQKLRDKGIDPYPAKSKKDEQNANVQDNFDIFKGKTLNLAGRIMGIRKHGKITFIDLQDQSGSLQLCIKQDAYTPQTDATLNSLRVLLWADLSLLDKGDYIQARGTVDKTQSGQVTLFVSEVCLLTKTLRPLPDSLENKEDKFRKRYVDLTIHPDEKARFLRKAKFWKVSRDFLAERGFIEVETPALEHVTGGADARPFITHHNELDQDFYLRISTELYQKRLIGAGFEKIYTFGPNFRNEGLSDEHLQEYYQIEWYWAYADYEDNMKLTKEMFRKVAQEVYGTTKFTTRGHSFDLADEWQVIDYVEVLKKTYGIDIFTTPSEEIEKILKDKGLDLGKGVNRNRLIDNLWKLIRKSLSGPVFLVNEPAFMSPLSKSKTDDPRLTQRYHVILAGSELANGYSEINDPIEQLNRFLDQQKLREEGDDEAQMLDIDFVEMLEYGMPPVSGHGHSERLFWFLEDCTGREGTLFPLLRHEVDSITKKIYPELSKRKISQVTGVTSRQTQLSSGKTPSRDEAISLVKMHINNNGLQKHNVAVGYAMRALAKHFKEDKELWEVAGILHDADWEKCKETPTEHSLKTVQWLKDAGYTNDTLFDAVLTHAHHVTGNRPPESKLEWSLYCCDELTGIIVANALIMPSKKLADISVESVIKKMNTKAFAASIDREGIRLCEEKLNLPLTEFVGIVLEGMREFAPELGL